MAELPLLVSPALGLVSLILAALHVHRGLRTPAISLELLPARRLRWQADDGALKESVGTLHEQWPVVVLRLGADGSTRVFWPDTLCDVQRRALRRWSEARPDASPLTQFWMG